MTSESLANFMSQDGLRAFLNRVGELTKKHIGTINKKSLFFNTVEELGEYAAACSVEAGRKNKVLKETARQESVDVVVCALSLFFAQGGTLDELEKYGNFKLNKWERNLSRKELKKHEN